jgi:hypothetical protein
MMSDQHAICVRCHRPVGKVEHFETFERMHWVCFHLEYEHDADPDEPCRDPACFWRRNVESGASSDTDEGLGTGSAKGS